MPSTRWTNRFRTAFVVALGILLWGPPLLALGQEGDRLLGAFAVTIAVEDVPPDLIDGASLIGRWHITFNEDGTYALGRQDVGALVKGEFITGGNTLTLRAETGVLACGSGPDDDAAASYEWQISDERLLLIAVDEPCDRRRLLLTTRTLAPFAVCPPLDAGPALATTGDQVNDRSGGRNATPAAATPGAMLVPAAEIDRLLKQMSDCWATRQPDRFLQLLSHDFQGSQRPESDDARRRFVLSMGAPIIWELVGEVDLIDDARATATVRQTLGDNIDTVRYAFVLEDGAWRWDGTDDGS